MEDLGVSQDKLTRLHRLGQEGREISSDDLPLWRLPAAPQTKQSTEDIEFDVNKLLQTLNHRERKLLRMRFGLDGGAEMTYPEIGTSLGISRERARQIVERALHKMRKQGKAHIFRDYLK